MEHAKKGLPNMGASHAAAIGIGGMLGRRDSAVLARRSRLRKAGSGAAPMAAHSTLSSLATVTSLGGA